MCGMCGFTGEGAESNRAEVVARMAATLEHRGPDASGIFVADGVALGHRRLSILDLSPAGAQPMSLPSGCTIAFNGEVYNFKNLRKELELVGAVFRGHSDTEVVLHAYQAWGLAGLQRLEGIFSIALWDARARRLVLMRDRLGVKPLFFADIGGEIFFASEIKALLATGRIGRSIDPQALSEYLWFGNAFEDRTMYGEVRSLLPGHWLIAEAGQICIEPWWSVEQWLDVSPRRSFDEAVAAVRESVDKAVARQLVADVPVGIFLSGGVDSSAIAATAVRHTSTRLSSYSVGFDFDRGINELPRARMIAARLGLDHHELHVRGAALQDVIIDLVKVHDEPFADAANIPLYLLAKGLGGAVKVVLQGDGGDELFAGYRRYSILRHAWAWSSMPMGAVSVLRRLGRHGERIARLAAAAGARDPARRMALLLTVEAEWRSPFDLLLQSARSDLERSTDPFRAFNACAARFKTVDPVQQMLLTDIHLQLPSQFLAKVDRATMAWGLEARVPLLDESILSLVVGFPSSYKVRGAQKKVVLREAMRDRVPSEVLDGPKTGFGVPYEHWLRTSLHGLAHESLLSTRFLQRFGFDRAGVSRVLEEHVSGRVERGFMLWKLLQLSLWDAIGDRQQASPEHLSFR
jgi:asparagine synthase (glutamine-hydrolysing)